MTDICPFSLGTATQNEHLRTQPYFTPIIERNSVLPISKTEMFGALYYNQTLLTVSIYQGDEPYAKDNKLLDEIDVKMPPAPRGEEKIEVRFTYDINGILDVEVTTVSTQKVIHKTVVKEELGLSDEIVRQQLQKMEEVKRRARDEENNQYVINLANALFRQTTGERRQLVKGALEIFEEALSSQEKIRIKKTRRWVLSQLQEVGGALFDFDDVVKEIMERGDSDE